MSTWQTHKIFSEGSSAALRYQSCVCLLQEAKTFVVCTVIALVGQQLQSCGDNTYYNAFEINHIYQRNGKTNEVRAKYEREEALAEAVACLILAHKINSVNFERLSVSKVRVGVLRWCW